MRAETRRAGAVWQDHLPDMKDDIMILEQAEFEAHYRETSQ